MEVELLLPCAPATSFEVETMNFIVRSGSKVPNAKFATTISSKTAVTSPDLTGDKTAESPTETGSAIYIRTMTRR